MASFEISKTTLTGIAKLVVIFACLAMWIFGKVTLIEMVAAIATIGGAVSALGFVWARDAGPGKDG